MRQLPTLTLALLLLATGFFSAAQTTCIKPAYDKTIRIIGWDNNIVENAAFELRKYKWSFDPDSTRATIVTDPAATLGLCAQMVSLNSIDGDALMSQDIPNLTAGYTYTMSAYLRSNLAVNTGALSMTLQVRFNYPSSVSTTIPVLFYPTSTWQKYSFSFTVPTTSNIELSMAQMLLSAGQNDTVWVDSVQIQNPNVVLNSDFESGLTGWSQIPNATRVLPAGYGAGGTATCMKLRSQTVAAGDALLTQTIPNLAVGKRYTVRCYMRSEHATPVNAAAVSLQARFNYTNGYVIYRDTLVKPDSVWRMYSYSFTVPDTFKLLVSLMQVSYYRGKQDSVYVDNLELLNPTSNTIYNFVNTSVPHPPVGIFEDNFTGTPGQPLDFEKWLVVKKTWGSNNNGVVPENIELLDSGGVRLHGHGNLYNGPVYGATTWLGNGKIHVGACIATKDYYASGKYEVVAKLTPGAINAFWTFHYIEDAAYQSGGIKNTEIDFEFPGAPTDTVLNPGYSGHKSYIDDMNVNTWGGLCNGEGYVKSKRYRTSPVVLSQDFHKYTIEWHTGGGGIAPSVSWYVDDTFARIITDTQYVGFRAARFWVGLWYSKDSWVNGGDTSIMQYVDTFMEVRSVKITPYYEPNDRYENETNPTTGYVTPEYHGYPLYPGSSGSKGGFTVPTEPLIEMHADEDVRVGVDIYDQQVLLWLVNTKGSLTGITIYNMNGQTVGHMSYRADDQVMQTAIPTARYAQGVYLMQCNLSDGHVFYRKMQVLK